MNKVELGSLIHTALRHSIKEQEKVVKHKSAAQLLPVIQRLAKFNVDLEEWYSGKYHLRENDRCNYFLHQAEEIEAEADRISEEIWEYVPVSLIPIFHRIRDRRVQIEKDDSYPRQLRAQFNNFRLALLEQVTGARFLENNANLGEEVERIMVQYLHRRLGNSVRILRGGHIYDYENSRSDQIDIIITPSNALGFCPADTSDGKHNVMIDQVIAAISVTSRLTPEKLRKRLEELQRIPLFKQKAESYLGLKDQPWPLCYIVGAECEDLDQLEKVWREVGSSEKPPVMILLLDSGYIMQRTFHAHDGEPFHQLASRGGIYAGLGLGWIEIQIAARNTWLTNQRADWIGRVQKQLLDLELSELPVSDPKREPWGWGNRSLHGVLRWGVTGKWVHNRLFVTSILARESLSIVEATLLDSTKAFPTDGIRDYKFEPRWFKQGVHAINGNFCALEEWIDPRDREKRRRRIAVFDSQTGDDVTSQMTQSLAECSEIEGLNPVLKNGP